MVAKLIYALATTVCPALSAAQRCQRQGEVQESAHRNLHVSRRPHQRWLAWLNLAPTAPKAKLGDWAPRPAAAYGLHSQAYKSATHTAFAAAMRREHPTSTGHLEAAMRASANSDVGRGWLALHRPHPAQLVALRVALCKPRPLKAAGRKAMQSTSSVSSNAAPTHQFFHIAAS